MAWEKGKYYTRTHRMGSRRVREYVGAGEAGVRAAAEDEARREVGRAAREEEMRAQEEAAALDGWAVELYGDVELVMRAVLLAEGYRVQRGEVRRMREGL